VRQLLFEGSVNVAELLNFERQELPPSLSGGCFCCLPSLHGRRAPDDGHRRITWHELLDQLKTLSRRVYGLKA
jgi:hypothetical protein